MNGKMNKSAAAVAVGLDAIDQLLAGAGIQKAASGTGPDSSHVSDRPDPNNMTPPSNSEFDFQRAELKAAVPNTLASDSNAYNNGTPLDGSFQGADGANEVTDAPEVTPSEVPEDTDAGTESPAQVDVNNVEGKSASFDNQLSALIKEQGLAKAAHIAGEYTLQNLDQILGTQKSAAEADQEWMGKVAAAEDFLSILREDPEGYIQEKVATVIGDAVADADNLYAYICEKAAEDEAAMLEEQAAGDEEEAAALEQMAAEEAGGEEQMNPEDIAALEEIAGGGDVGGEEGGSPLDGISEEELIEALSEALDANNASPEELPEMEAANLPPEMPPEVKEAAVNSMAEWAMGVNQYRNALRTGRVQVKRASVKKIQLVSALTNRIAEMRRY